MANEFRNVFALQSIAVLAVLCCLICWPNQSFAQVGNNDPGTGVTIQLPTISVFNVNTVVSVPDGGTMSLGGVSRYSGGQTSRGLPGFGGIPYVNRPFRNQAFGYDASSSRASVSVQIISLEEQAAVVMREAERRAALRQPTDPNGSVEIQKRADFLSRHMGRKR